MWTEIMNPCVGVTHVEGQNVVFPIDSDENQRVVESHVRAAVDELERRTAHERVTEQVNRLAEELEKQQQMNEMLARHGADLRPSNEWTL